MSLQPSTRSISAAEHAYIVAGCNVDVRNDGRSRFEFRPFSIDTSPTLLPNTNGAAKISVGTDLKTEILCGIKLEIAQPTLSSSSTPSQGRLAVSVTLSPAVAKDYSNHEANELTTSCEKLLERVLRGCVNLQELVIIENKVCWMLCIDVVVMSLGGALLDAISMAVRAALINTSVPKAEVIKNVNDELDFEISDDPFAAKKLNGSDKFPIVITLSKVGAQYFIVDTRLEEELVATSKLCVAVDAQGATCGMQLAGSGGVSIVTMNELIETARVLGRRVLRRMDRHLQSSNAGESIDEIESDDENAM